MAEHQWDLERDRVGETGNAWRVARTGEHGGPLRTCDDDSDWGEGGSREMGRQGRRGEAGTGCSRGWVPGAKRSDPGGSGWTRSEGGALRVFPQRARSCSPIAHPEDDQSTGQFVFTGLESGFRFEV